jgi:hypothetical protein
VCGELALIDATTGEGWHKEGILATGITAARVCIRAAISPMGGPLAPSSLGGLFAVQPGITIGLSLRSARKLMQISTEQLPQEFDIFTKIFAENGYHFRCKWFPRPNHVH